MEMPGYEVVARVSGSKEPGVKDGQPLIWRSQKDNYRIFYSQLGHHPETYHDPEFERHILGAILWAARRAD